MNNNVFLAKAKAMVLSEIDCINVALLSEKLKYHPAHLYRKILASANCTPSFFIKEIRMEESKKLLLTTNKLIKDIGYSVGYTTPSHFVESFRKFYGVTPEMFRKQI